MSKKIIKSISILLAFLLGMSLVSSGIDPFILNISVFGLLFPYILLPCGLLTFFLFKNFKPYFFVLAVLIGWGFSELPSYVQLSGKSRPLDSNSDSFTVMSFNAMMGIRLIDNNRVISREVKLDFADLMNTDPAPGIICTQETSTLVEQLLRTSTQYPYLHKIENRGAVILSKYPIVNRGQVDFGPRINSCLWADIAIGADTIRIYSVHLESNRLSQRSFDFLTEEDYESAQAINGIKDIFQKYSRYSIVRVKQAKAIKEHATKSKFPVIICGDFNEAPISFTYRILKRDLTDTFKSSGAGLGSSWNGDIPLLRIDYILADKKLNNTHFTTLHTSLSDHYPIKAVFEMK